MTVNLSMFAGAGAQFLDNNGNVLSGGLVYTYAAGTTTPQSTYTSSSGSTPHTNPIVLDSAGRVPGGEIWLTEATSYKFVLQTSTAVLIATYDDVTGATDGSTQIAAIYANLANTSDVAKGDDLIGFRQSNASGAFSAAVGKTVHDKLQDLVSVKDFGAVGDGVADDSTAIINAFAAVNEVLFPEGTYRISADVTIPVTKVVSMAGGASFTVDSGKTLKIYGQFNAPIGQYLFKGAGTTQGIRQVFPEWFGAVGDGTTDDQPALQKSTACVQDSYGSFGGRPTIILGNRNYCVHSTWFIYPTANVPMGVEGAGTLLGGTRVIGNSTLTSPAIAIEGDSDSTQCIVDFVFRGVAVVANNIGQGVGIAFNTISGHKLIGLQESLFEDVHVSAFRIGIFIQKLRQVNFARVSVWNDLIDGSIFANANYCVQIKDTVNGEAGSFSGDFTWAECQFVNNKQSYSFLVSIECVTAGNNLAGMRFHQCIFYRGGSKSFLIGTVNGTSIGNVWITDGQFDDTSGILIKTNGTTDIITDVHITNNYFTAVDGNCVRVETGSFNSVNSLIIANNWSAGITNAAVDLGGASGTNIVNNVFTGCGWTAGAAINLSNCREINVTGNNFGQGGPVLAGGFTNMIANAGGGDYFVFQGNNSAGLASGILINNSTGAAHVSITGNI